MDNFNEYSNHKYHKVIQQKLYPLSQSLLMYGSSMLTGKKRLEHILRMIKGYNKYRTSINIKEILYYNIVLFAPFLIKWYKFITLGNTKNVRKS